MKKPILLLAVVAMLATSADAQNQQRRPRRGDHPREMNWKRASRDTSYKFLHSQEAVRIADQVLLYQRVTGGWPKNIDFARQLTDADREQIAADHNKRDDSTTDNNATNREIAFLARMYGITGNEAYREAVIRGIDYLLSGQYDNGGWPQFWPEMNGYARHITYNDDAMANTMQLLIDVRDGKDPFAGIADAATKARAAEAIEKGYDCILNTQIIYNGEPTVWCQQHYADTYLPAPARAFELPSFCSVESARLLSMLMDIDNPSERVKRAVHGGMKWFDTYKLTGVRLERSRSGRSGFTTSLVTDPTADTPLWARFYDFDNCRPFVCDRDGIPRRSLEEIGFERRNGYGWYSSNPAELYEKYERWADRYDKANKVTVDLHGKGANERGLYDGLRYKVNPADFDVVVNPGQSITEAIASVPDTAKTCRILVRNGHYNEKVLIRRPGVVLVGENRDSTIITYAEGRNTPEAFDADGEKLQRGVISIYPEADNCVISGITAINNYGSTVEPTTSHQFTIFGRAPHVIVINSNIHSDGNDALSLWAQGGEGMYYHSDLNVSCKGVDFICPRGWCYATRCNFYGDGHTMIWHDGRGHADKKFVITCSTFDAASPTPLGRYHHDSQFYLSNCTLSDMVNDSDIAYAYTDKVLDECPMGRRVYYWECTRDGGDSGWLENNLATAPGKPEYHTLTARWTFDGRWDPESRIRELWPLLAY